jgi:hypothetical protein
MSIKFNISASNCSFINDCRIEALSYGFRAAMKLMFWMLQNVTLPKDSYSAIIYQDLYQHGSSGANISVSHNKLNVHSLSTRFVFHTSDEIHVNRATSPNVIKIFLDVHWTDYNQGKLKYIEKEF